MRAAREAAEKAAAQLDLGPFGECHKVEDLNSLQKGLHVSVVHRMSFRHFGTQPKDTGGSTKEGSTGRVGSHPGSDTVEILGGNVWNRFNTGFVPGFRQFPGFPKLKIPNIPKPLVSPLRMISLYDFY